MTDKTVTVALTIPNHDTAKDIARVLRADGYEQHAETIEAALPPEWEEGTVAWVTRTDKDRDHRFLCTYDGKGWRVGGRVPLSEQHRVTKVEPLRVLGDDEVAVKRPFGVSAKASDIRRWADMYHRGMQSFYVMYAYADALEAEERAR